MNKKCVCGYVFKGCWDPEKCDVSPGEGDEKFIRITAHNALSRVMDFQDNYGHEVRLFACPNCKTIQMASWCDD